MNKSKKNRNIKHTHSGRIVASGHNMNDREFLRGNAGVLAKLQQKMS